MTRICALEWYKSMYMEGRIPRAKNILNGHRIGKRLNMGDFGFEGDEFLAFNEAEMETSTIGLVEMT